METPLVLGRDVVLPVNVEQVVPVRVVAKNQEPAVELSQRVVARERRNVPREQDWENSLVCFADPLFDLNSRQHGDLGNRSEDRVNRDPERLTNDVVPAVPEEDPVRRKPDLVHGVPRPIKLSRLTVGYHDRSVNADEARDDCHELKLTDEPRPRRVLRVGVVDLPQQLRE